MNVMLRILDEFLYQDPISQTRIFRVLKLTVAQLKPQFFLKNGILKNKKKCKKYILKNE